MIIEFSVQNYKSIKELQTISFLAANLKSKNPLLDEQNVHLAKSNLKLLKSIGLYGANGSGKSNIVKACHAMLWIIKESMKNDEILKKRIDPFRLNSQTINEPSYFQLQFLIDGKRYRYGFEATSTAIISEWLFGPAQKKETYYFTRSEGEIKINQEYFREGLKLSDKTSETNLFLNVVNAFNGPISKVLKQYFTGSIRISSATSARGFRDETLNFMEDELAANRIIQLLNDADFGINEITLGKNSEIDPLSANIHSNKLSREVYTHREIFDDEGVIEGKERFEFDKHESAGTRRIFNLSGILIKTLTFGRTLIIDEFDARFHPLLSRKIVEMFHSPKLNKKGAQLLFITHDTNLLDKELLRRDQIYFAEKNKLGSTHFYSLFDFKGIRNDASYEKDYILGKYGAIPFLGDFNNLIDVEKTY